MVRGDPLLALLPAARSRWARTDRVLHRLAREHPPEPWPVDHHHGFEVLVASIIAQQVSLAAGRTIQMRVSAALGGRVTAERVLGADPKALRAAGLSKQKLAYVQDLAAKTAAGTVGFGRFPGMSDDEVIADLTAVKGIGVWTAKMFLMFHLLRPDVLAPEDLGLRIAVSRFYRVPAKRAAAFMERKRPDWSPYATLAARVLWHARRAEGAAPSTRVSRMRPKR